MKQSIKVRKATEEDSIDRLVEMTRKQAAVVYPNHTFDEEYAKEYFATVLHLPNFQMFVAYEDDILVGFIVCIVQELPFYRGLLVSTEIPWYVDKCKNRRKIWFLLLEEHEKWSKEMGCDYITIGNYDDRLTSVYQENDYEIQSETLRKKL